MDLLNHEEKPQSRTGYFWWSIVLLLLTGACFASWILSFYIVAHPENPRCYRILKKLKRLDPPTRFLETKVPRGEFLSAGRILERFGKFGPEELARENDQLLRSYLMNYRETKIPPVYVIGRYDVVETHVLRPIDFFPSGAVVLTQSLDTPQVLLEMVFPARPPTGVLIRDSLPAGCDVSLARSRDLLALIHVARLDDGRMQFTAVPLPYGGWQVKGGTGHFQLKSPEELETVAPEESKKGLPAPAPTTLDVSRGLPIVREERLKKGLTAYSEYRRKALSQPHDDDDARDPMLVRWDPSKDEIEEAVTPRIIRAPAPPTPRPVPVPVPPVPLTPRPRILSEAPAASLPGGNDVAVPRRVLTVKEAGQIAESFTPSPPAVLSGQFVVTLVSGQHVEMRPVDSPGSGAVVMVRYASGTKVPKLGTTVGAGPSRNLLIQRIARGATGEVTIFASEQAL